jgi:pantothenate kinase-related protein Tda10
MKPIVGEIKVSRISKAGKIRHSHPAILEGWCTGVEPTSVTFDTIPWLNKKKK